ncbi:hypothetical protein ACFQJC_00450 [Haloferax namakaokahaiae]|uniref:Lipoprotein n=1 Tax=Haloferax namakaokahaiae TaxID=1748331 RepID=A0ABD5Z9W9_9EURY
MRRRTYLGTLSMVSVALAGCTSTDDGASDDAETGAPAAEATTTEATETEQTGETEEAMEQDTAADDLDLREANVMAVEFEQQGEEYRFDVTLLHDDDGEDGYANWWQVETLDGTELGRRDLLHAHGTQEFTRSETISIPAETPCVVVRGHDQTHGYGGQAMLVNLESGETRAVQQGPDPQSFADVSC